MEPVIIRVEDIPTTELAEDHGIIVFHFCGQSLAAVVDWVELEDRVGLVDEGFEVQGIEDGDRIIRVRWALRMALRQEGINSESLLLISIINAGFLLMFDAAEEDTSGRLAGCSRPVLHVALDEFDQVSLRAEDSALVPAHSPAAPRRVAVH